MPRVVVLPYDFCISRPHDFLDRRSLAMHKLAAAKVRAHPELLDLARETVQRWKRTAPSRAHALLDEWIALIDRGVDDCLSVAEEDSEHARQLRQSSPLPCLLDRRERNEFMRSWRQS